MANATLARKRGIRGRWLGAGIVLVIVAIIVALVINGAGRAATQAGPASLGNTVAVTRGDLVSTIAGSGTIDAEQSLSLSFQVGGTVTEVLVKSGDSVQAGQALAKLDDRALQLALTSAQASLASAQARLQQAKQGNARPEDIAAAQAAVASAQANYDKLVAGATSTDLASAQAAVASAQAAYDAAVVAAGTTGSQLEAARASLQKAQVALEKAQLDYTDAIQKNANDRAALAAYQQAQIDYQQAKANYDSLADTAGSDANSKIQAAAAQLEQAKANLAKLTNPATAADLAAAQASIDQAKANLAKLTAPATETDIAIQEAAVTQAEAAVKQAELNLEQATLRAPFAGLVTDVSIVPGSQVNAATPAISLMDVSTMHVKMLLNENDVVRAKLGQPVQLSIDSLPDWQATGAVDYIAPSAQKVNGVVTYDVKVTFANSDPRIKAGMTANLTIVVANKKGVLLVPNTALLPKGAGHVVQVPNADGKGFTEVDVTTGLTDGTNTEIVSGLSEGQRIIAVPTSALPKPRGFFGG